MGRDRLSGLFVRTRTNAVLFWLFTALLVALTGYGYGVGSMRIAILATALVVVAVVPPVAFRDPAMTLPWELVAVAGSPPLLDLLAGFQFRTEVVPYASVAVLALLVVVELHTFTQVRMNHPFAILLATLTTLSAAAMYNIGLWLSDTVLGTAYLIDGRHVDEINAVVMAEFSYAAIGGLVAGLAFVVYFRHRAPPRGDEASVESRSGPDRNVPSERATLADRLHLSVATQRRSVRAMQVMLALVFVNGLVTLHLPMMINAGVALVVTFVPAILKRDLRVSMDPGLVLWITSAIFLHVLGSVRLYSATSPWDHLTHALSATIVAAVGYTLFRVADLHTDEVYIPSRFMVVLILVFVLAAGVVWELIEFTIEQTAAYVGLSAVLVQYGIHDTIADLLFNLGGGVVVAIWGTVYLTDVTRSLADRVGRRVET